MSLVDLRARAEQVRPAGGEPAAVVLVELAEAEPLLGHRQGVVHGLLEEAAKVLDTLGNVALEGRVLLRLACVKLLEGDLEAVQQLTTRAEQRLEGDHERGLQITALRARVLVRRKRFEDAGQLLASMASSEPADALTVEASRAAAHVVLAMVELSFEQEDWEATNRHLDVLHDAVHGDEDLLEYEFLCEQRRGAVALATGYFERAAKALRAVVSIAKQLGAVEDEVEARLALAGSLVSHGQLVELDEAEKHLQISRDRALEADLDSLHTAALMGQAGLLAKRGKTQAALDRCLEIARSASAKQDLSRYSLAIALMSQIYEQLGDLASAYRTFAEAHAALRESVGEKARDVIVPHIAAFADRIGQEKFREIAENVNKAAHARNSFHS